MSDKVGEYQGDPRARGAGLVFCLKRTSQDLIIIWESPLEKLSEQNFEGGIRDLQTAHVGAEMYHLQQIQVH